MALKPIYPWESGTTLSLAELGNLKKNDEELRNIRKLEHKTALEGSTSDLNIIPKFLWLAPLGINLKNVFLNGSFLIDVHLRLLGRTLNFSCPNLKLVDISSWSMEREAKSVGIGLMTHDLNHVSDIRLSYLLSPEETFVALIPFKLQKPSTDIHTLGKMFTFTSLRINLSSLYREDKFVLSANSMVGIITKNLRFGSFIGPGKLFNSLSYDTDEKKRQWYRDCFSNSNIQFKC